MAGWGYGRQWRPYVSVAQRRAKAKRYAAKLAKNGRKLLPVEIAGRKIATTFWGAAWCDNLESYSDFENRLPRGRTYVRNGSVIDLQIAAGCVTGIVSGSEMYDVKIDITPLKASDWKKIKLDCSQSIDSLMDLLQGRFSKGVMERLTRQREGLFPQPKEIKMQCSCPDWAVLCKHVAAVLYGVGARLDTDPEMLFQLRQVDHLDLIGQAVDGANLDQALAAGDSDTLAEQDLGEIFGIEIDDASSAATATATKKKVRRKRRSKTPAAKTKKTASAAKGQRKKPAAKKAKTRSASTAKHSAKKKVSTKKKTSAKPKTAARKKKKTATSSTRSTKTKAKKKK